MSGGTSSDGQPDDRPEAVVFDLGGVFTASPRQIFRAVMAEAGHQLDDARRMPWDDYVGSTDHPMHRVERGELPVADMLDEMTSPFDPLVMMRRVMAPETFRPEMVAVAEELRDAGVRLAMVTNNVREMREHWFALHDWASLFEVIIDSSEVGLRKPEPAIFRLVLDRLGVDDPAATVMVDDFPENLEAAAALGMRTVHVDDDPTDAIAALRALV